MQQIPHIIKIYMSRREEAIERQTIAPYNIQHSITYNILFSMEDHFSRLLDAGGSASSSNATSFIESGGTFRGARPGYVFKNGDLGIGYYYDKVSAKGSIGPLHQEDTKEDSRKRKLDSHGNLTSMLPFCISFLSQSWFLQTLQPQKTMTSKDYLRKVTLLVSLH